MTTRTDALHLEPQTLEVLRAALPELAAITVAQVVADVPEYAGGFRGEMARTIPAAVQMALAAFLDVAARADPAGPVTPRSAIEGAYDLGRGEARSGRTADALLAAYRSGARVAWREMSARAVGAGMPAATVARLAEVTFAYIDELSAASVAGHSDEITKTGRVRERYLQQLGEALLAGHDEADLLARAERADWARPSMLTAVLLPGAHVRAVLPLLDAGTLVLNDEAAGATSRTVLLVPDPVRPALLRAVQHRGAVVGPPRPWQQAAASYARAVRARDELGALPGVLDTERHLAALVLRADREALADLRAQVLAPLAELRPAAAERLAETLRSWLLHQGRREEVAAELFVHPQTVRYRMGQLRELYGERLQDPDVVLELTLALALPATAPASGAGPQG